MICLLKKKFLEFPLIRNYHILKKKNFYQILEKANNLRNITNIIQIFNLKKINKKKFSHYSQIGQDIFVASFFNLKKKGFFIEIGAGDGIYHSNTYFLEKYYNWRGILVEPCKFWKKNKKIRKKSIWVEKIIFNKTGLLIGFDHNQKKPFNSKINFNKTVNKVKTINMKDLLSYYKVPKDIDYMSIDIEGDEYKVLKQIDFNKYNIKVLTIEDNNNKTKIKKLLLSAGYAQVHPKYTYFESWFFKKKYGNTIKRTF